jgi:hypothetical protein
LWAESCMSFVIRCFASTISKGSDDRCLLQQVLLEEWYYSS